MVLINTFEVFGVGLCARDHNGCNAGHCVALFGAYGCIHLVYNRANWLISYIVCISSCVFSCGSIPTVNVNVIMCPFGYTVMDRRARTIISSLRNFCARFKVFSALQKYTFQ